MHNPESPQSDYADQWTPEPRVQQSRRIFSSDGTRQDANSSAKQVKSDTT